MTFAIRRGGGAIMIFFNKKHIESLPDIDIDIDIDIDKDIDINIDMDISLLLTWEMLAVWNRSAGAG